MLRESTPTPEPTILKLQALAWICSDDARAQRLVTLTGLDPATLRERALDPDVLGSVGAFLMAHEPDLMACADAIGVPPQMLAGALA